jgi:DNA-binding FrmR family transcriptional regulator
MAEQLERPTVPPSERPPAGRGGSPSPPRSDRKDRAQLIRRLARMEGQVRGIARMVERQDDCVDILQQTAALRAAVDALALLLLEDHVTGCVASAAQAGVAGGYAEEVMEVVRRSMGRPARATRPVGDG